MRISLRARASGLSADLVVAGGTGGDEIGTLEPGEVGAIAARALNVNLGRADQETAASGKP